MARAEIHGTIFSDIYETDDENSEFVIQNDNTKKNVTVACKNSLLKVYCEDLGIGSQIMVSGEVSTDDPCFIQATNIAIRII